MKKSLMLLMTVSSMMYAAEPVLERAERLLVPYKGTLIQVIRGTMGRPIIPTTDLVVVGLHEQRILQQSPLDDRNGIGLISVFELKNIFVKYEYCDSGSDDDTYKPFTSGVARSWNNACSIKYNPPFIAVAEPCIEFGFFKNDQQQQCRYHNDSGDYLGNEAITKAQEDLAVCYKNSLRSGVHLMGTGKCVSFASLGIGFPSQEATPITVKTVLEFIENNPHAYALIQLFVKKRSDFALYKKLFGPWLDEQ